MLLQTLQFKHFHDEVAFCKLQEYFGSFDYKRRYDEVSKPLEEMKIMTYDPEKEGTEKEYKELDFHSDIFEPRIEKLSRMYIDNFIKEIDNRSLFSDDNLDGFAKYYRNKLGQEKSSIIKSKLHLEEYIKVVLSEIEKLEEFTENYFKNPYPHITNEIKFNWSKTQVVYFFHLLRSNKQIEWMEDADLGRIIDRIFKFQNKSKPEEYLKITRARKVLNDFKNQGGKSENSSNEAIQKILMNKDFYNL